VGRRLNEPLTNQLDTSEVNINSKIPAIETVDLKKHYIQGGKKLKVLKGINLRVMPGEFLAIMGPSGSGKSTILNMIGALDRPSSGKVSINGIDLSTLNDDELAEFRNKELGFIFQFYNLIPRIDAQTNVELPMSIKGVPITKRKERAKELLSLVGLGKRLDHKPSQLSGGEQQRVAIARALANEPTLILADEVTGDLDTQTGDEIMVLLKEINEEKGATFVLITHDPLVAQKTNRILHIRDGVLKAEKKMNFYSNGGR
jgi:putative ABC transport system ATP-binding protein